jgi:hypothetical protein
MTASPPTYGRRLANGFMWGSGSTRVSTGPPNPGNPAAAGSGPVRYHVLERHTACHQPRSLIAPYGR